MSFFVKVLRLGGVNLGEEVGYLEVGECCEIGVSPFTEGVLAMIKTGDLALCDSKGNPIGPPAINDSDKVPFNCAPPDDPSGQGHSTFVLPPQVNK